jgi:hypothetical protein
MFNLLTNEFTDKSALSKDDVAMIAGAPFGIPPPGQPEAMLKMLNLLLPPSLPIKDMAPLIQSLITSPTATALARTREYVSRNPLPIADPYDDGKEYNAGDKILWTDGKVYQFKEYIGAAGYHPDNHPDRWTLVNSQTVPAPPSQGTAAATPYDNQKSYKKGDKVTLNGKEYMCIDEYEVFGLSPETNPDSWKEVTSGGYRRKSRKVKKSKKAKRTYRR